MSQQTTPTGQTTSRQQDEIDHGKRLAEGDPEKVWGWGTAAGKLRAERRARLISCGADLKPGVRALEIGCGTGLFTTMFASTGASIVAVDLSDELLEYARARGISNATFLHKGFEECAVDGPFNAVIGSSVLHHLDLPVALPKILSLLRPGGIMSFAEPNMLNPQVALQKNVPWIKQCMGESPGETAFVSWRLASQLESYGFEMVEIVPFDLLHPMVPTPFIPAVQKIGRIIESMPILRGIAGSLYIRARKPN
jgi:2-polyprenyl-3-methyl-5-hydroxy-6-metoxy-1,4-benzoquinol methylase